jgi:hypothetical protein
LSFTRTTTAANADNVGPMMRVGTATATATDDAALTIDGVPFGDTGVYVYTARGNLMMGGPSLARTVEDILHKTAAKLGGKYTGVPQCVAAVADAITALRLSVEARKGKTTDARFWRHRYYAICVEEHRRMWPKIAVADPYADAQYEARLNPPGKLIRLYDVRKARDEAQRIAAAKAIAAEKERTRIASALVEQADGQIRAAF